MKIITALFLFIAITFNLPAAFASAEHPGLLHTYIHMTELDLHDPPGLIAAEKLPAWSHGRIAHYTHMPNHIYWRRDSQPSVTRPCDAHSILL